MQIPGYFEDMNYLHVNTEPDRAYLYSSFWQRLLLSGSGEIRQVSPFKRFLAVSVFWKRIRSAAGVLEGGSRKGKRGAGSCRMAELRRGWKPVYQHPVSISLWPALCAEGKSLRAVWTKFWVQMLSRCSGGIFELWGCGFLLLCVDQRNLCGIFPGIPFHQWISHLPGIWKRVKTAWPYWC